MTCSNFLNYQGCCLYSTVEDLARWDHTLVEGTLLSEKYHTAECTRQRGCTTPGDMAMSGGCKGIVTHVIIHQGGDDTSAKKIKQTFPRA